jgi:hypothetical protein
MSVMSRSRRKMHEALPVDEVPNVADVVDIVSGELRRHPAVPPG